MLSTIPQRVIRHIATSAGLEEVLADLENYEKVGSRKKHLPLIRDWLQIKAFRDGGQLVLQRALENACQTKDIIADIINAGIEELVHHRYELPGFSSLHRAARDARSVVNRAFYQNVYDSISKAQRARIERLLARQESEAHSEWHRLKQEPLKVTTKNVRQFISHLLWLVSLNTEKKEAKLDLSWIPPKWWKQVTGTQKRDADISKVDRRYFEICLFSRVWLELKSGDLFIEGSEKFGDWRNQLIDKELLDASLEGYCQQIGCPKTAETFVESLKVWLSDTIQKVDATFPDNESVSIKEGEPVIRKHTSH